MQAAQFLQGFVDTAAGATRGDIKARLYAREQLREAIKEAQHERELRSSQEYKSIMAAAAQARADAAALNYQDTQNYHQNTLNETIRHNKAMEEAAGGKEIYDASLDGFIDPQTKTFTPLKGAPSNNKPSDAMKIYKDNMKIVEDMANDPVSGKTIKNLSPGQLTQWMGHVERQRQAGIAPVNMVRPNISQVITPWYEKNKAETTFYNPGGQAQPLPQQQEQDPEFNYYEDAEDYVKQHPEYSYILDNEQIKGLPKRGR